MVRYHLKKKTTYDKKDLKALKEKEAEENSFYSEEEINEEYKNITISAKATITSENNVITAKITTVNKEKEKQTVTQTMKFGDVQVQTLNNDEMLVINDYTEDDFSALTMEIMTNGIKTAQEKPNTLVGTLFGFLNSFSGMLSNGTETDEELPTNTNIEDSDKEKLSETDISKGKEYVHSSIETALNTQLDNYKNDLKSDPNTNPGDYLTAEKIESQAGASIRNIEIIDGGTLKCEYKESTYFVKIYIDGDTWSLQDLEILYSEDGKLENAR